MRTIDISKAKSDFSRLMNEVAQTKKPFIIAKRGKPLVKVVPIYATGRLGFLEGQIKVPDDFDTMMADEIEEMFYGKP
jgi:prevent-host-death family protein